MEGFTLYQIVRPLKLHFTTENYDALKYHGKLRSSFETFLQRKDYTRYETLGSKFTNKTKAGQWVLANMVYGDPETFLYDPFENTNKVFLKWRGIREAISKHFADDLDLMLSKLPYESWFDVTPKGNLPPLLQMVSRDLVKLETAILLNKQSNIFDKWSILCHNDPYMMKVLMKLKKYSPFVKFDVENVDKILLEKVRNG